MNVTVKRWDFIFRKYLTGEKESQTSQWHPEKGKKYKVILFIYLFICTVVVKHVVHIIFSIPGDTQNLIGQGTELPALSRAGRLDYLKIPPNLSPLVFLLF